MKKAQRYDLVILGRGAAAFSAAIRASELSNGEMNIAMVGTGPLGGTCVNVGCVPSKYLLEASHAVFNPQHPRIQGVRGTRIDYSFAEIMNGLREYVRGAREKKYELVIGDYENVRVIEGLGKFVDRKKVAIYDQKGKERSVLAASNVLIATGSRPSIPNIEGLRDAGFLTSDTIWNLKALPESVLIIGGGAIGLELGQALLHLGSRVSVIEAMNSLLPQTEPEIGVALKESLQNEGMEFYMRARISKVEKGSGGKYVHLITHEGRKRIGGQEIIVATGREPNTDYLDLERAGVKMDGRGAIITSDRMETSVPGIYAAGDCVSKRMYLETIAAREGAVAVSNMFGEDLRMDYNSAAWAVFTNPQVAGVGMTENEFSRKTGACSCRTFSLENLTKASITGETKGMIKITVDPKDNRIVGMHIMAPNATDIITEGAYAVRYGYTIEDIIETSHIFPSFSEGVKLAAQSFIRDISKMSCCVE
ncbi:MAG: mercury(II) reductase [Thermoplasmata archaeon]